MDVDLVELSPVPPESEDVEMFEPSTVPPTDDDVPEDTPHSDDHVSMHSPSNSGNIAKRSLLTLFQFVISSRFIADDLVPTQPLNHPDQDGEQAFIIFTS